MIDTIHENLLVSTTITTPVLFKRCTVGQRMEIQQGAFLQRWSNLTKTQWLTSKILSLLQTKEQKKVGLIIRVREMQQLGLIT